MADSLYFPGYISAAPTQITTDIPDLIGLNSPTMKFKVSSDRAGSIVRPPDPKNFHGEFTCVALGLPAGIQVRDGAFPVGAPVTVKGALGSVTEGGITYPAILVDSIKRR